MAAPASIAAGDREAFAWAARFLRSRGLTVTEVLRVNFDSILFLGVTRTPMTAWYRRQKSGAIEMRHEPGFPAEPHPDLWPLPEPATADAA